MIKGERLAASVVGSNDQARGDKEVLPREIEKNKALAAVLRAAAAVLEADVPEPAVVQQTAPERYYVRPGPLDGADWDRAAGRDFPVFRTGRRLLARVDDVHAYLERAPAQRKTKPTDQPANNVTAIPFRRAAR